MSVNILCSLLPVRRAARRYGLKEAMEGEDWTLFWTDCSVSLDRVRDMKRYQVRDRSCFVLYFKLVDRIYFVFPEDQPFPRDE